MSKNAQGSVLRTLPFSCIPSLLLFLTILTPWLAGCGGSDIHEHHFSGPTMGTWYNVKVIAPLSQEDRSAISQAIQEALEYVNQRMSTYLPESELSQLNAHPADVPFPLSSDTLKVLAYAEQVSRESNGAFDVTVGPLVNAWGFGPENPEARPGEAQIEALLERVGYDKLQLDIDAGTVTKHHDEIYIDLSGIAKGYAVDVVARTVEDFGLENFLVDIGGDMIARGHNARKTPWRIAIESPLPDTRAIHSVIPLQDIALATSGDYRNFIEVDGMRLSHTIDPSTGQPIMHDLASVSVLHDSCALADAYATAIMVLGSEAGMALAEERDLAVLLLIHNNGDDFLEASSSTFKAMFPDE